MTPQSHSHSHSYSHGSNEEFIAGEPVGHRRDLSNSKSRSPPARGGNELIGLLPGRIMIPREHKRNPSSPSVRMVPEPAQSLQHLWGAKKSEGSQHRRLSRQGTAELASIMEESTQPLTAHSRKSSSSVGTVEESVGTVGGRSLRPSLDSINLDIFSFKNGTAPPQAVSGSNEEIQAGFQAFNSH